MRRTFYALCLILVVTTISRTQGFPAVHSPDGVKVWAVGDAGNVFLSTNGGVNWASYTRGPGLSVPCGRQGRGCGFPLPVPACLLSPSGFVAFRPGNTWACEN